MTAALSPTVARATLVVALGTQRYRVERPFGDLGTGPGFVSDVTVAAGGRVLTLIRCDSQVDADRAAVIEVDREGRQQAAWGGDLIADGHLHTAAGDRLLIVDRDMHEVVICSLDGRRIGGLGHRGEPLAPFNHPTDLAVAPNGDIYVSDGYAASLVHRFSAAGEHVQSWGEIGDSPGAFLDPHSVAVLGDGRVLVADRGNHRIQVFTADGRLLDVWSGFYKPMSIAIDGRQRVLVTDQVPSLHLLDGAGQRIGRCRPVLNGAHGVDVDDQGCIYLAEMNPSRLSRLVPL